MAAVPVYLSILFAIAFANVIVQGDWPENATQPEISIITAPHHVTVEKKSPLLLNCSVETSKTFGPLQFTWLKDGQPLAPQLRDRRIQVYQNGSLYFRRIVHRKRRENRLSDEGLYECVAGNGNGSVVARRVRVEVAGIARNFTQEPSPVLTHIGGSARFDCSIKATPPATIVWQRDNVQLTIDDGRFVQLPSGALQIHNVSEADEGSYRCMAAQNFNHLPDEVSNIKWKWSRSASLRFRPVSPAEKMHLLASPLNTTAMAGETVILECLADGVPPPSIEWHRHDRKALSDRHQMYGRGNLIISNVISEDAGVYQCVLKKGPYKQTHEATLSVHTYPVMINDPESNDWPMTRTVSLFCEVEGNPKPTILWYFNGVPIHQLEKEKIKYELREENMKLIVYTIRLENAGYYQCVAENTIGQVFAVARIVVYAHKHAPPQPQNVTVTAVSSSELRVEWQQEETEFPILTSLITYRLREEKILKEKQRMVRGTVRSVNLEGLLPYTTYVVTIRSFTKKGSSMQSIVEGRTLEGVPLAVPMFQVSSPSAQTMLVTWEELEVKDRGGVIVAYQLQYRPAYKPSTVTTHTINDPNQRSFLITEVQPETVYEVRLLAATQKGFPAKLGDWSHFTTPRVSAGGGSTPQLKVDVLNSTAVLLHFEPLEVVEGGSHNYYIQAIDLRHMDSQQVPRSIMVNLPVPRYILTGLENNTDYEVTVYASQREIQVTHTFRISEGSLVPTAIKLRSRVVNPNTIRLEWTPSVKNRAIMKYQVCYKEAMSSAGLMDQCMDSERPYAVISELAPFTKYTFGVRIVLDQRQGDFIKLQVETTEDKPSPPVNLTYEVLKRGSVRLQWSPPSQPNGVITSYVIFYNMDSDMPESLWKNLTKTGQQTIAQVDGLDVRQYFFKMSACNKAGRGHPSQVVMVYPDCISSSQCTSTVAGIVDGPTDLTDKQVGIIIGVSIGVACIIVCVVVILCRHRCFRVNNGNPTTLSYLGNPNGPIYHGNGHVPGIHNHGNGHVHAPLAGDQNMGVEMTALETMPMLTRLPENEMSDAKGGGDMIVTPNGVRVNGLVKMNGHLPNGHITPANLDLSATSEERRSLIEAMLAATNGTPHNPASEATLTTNSDPYLDAEGDSLTDIDRWDSAAEMPQQEKKNNGSVPSAAMAGGTTNVVLAGNVSVRSAPPLPAVVAGRGEPNSSSSAAGGSGSNANKVATSSPSAPAVSSRRGTPDTTDCDLDSDGHGSSLHSCSSGDSSIAGGNKTTTASTQARGQDGDGGRQPGQGSPLSGRHNNNNNINNVDDNGGCGNIGGEDGHDNRGHHHHHHHRNNSSREQTPSPPPAVTTPSFPHSHSPLQRGIVNRNNNNNNRISDDEASSSPAAQQQTLSSSSPLVVSSSSSPVAPLVQSSTTTPPSTSCTGSSSSSSAQHLRKADVKAAVAAASAPACPRSSSSAPPPPPPPTTRQPATSQQLRVPGKVPSGGHNGFYYYLHNNNSSSSALLLPAPPSPPVLLHGKDATTATTPTSDRSSSDGGEGEGSGGGGDGDGVEREVAVKVSPQEMAVAGDGDGESVGSVAAVRVRRTLSTEMKKDEEDEEEKEEKKRKKKKKVVNGEEEEASSCHEEKLPPPSLLPSRGDDGGEEGDDDEGGVLVEEEERGKKEEKEEEKCREEEGGGGVSFAPRSSTLPQQKKQKTSSSSSSSSLSPSSSSISHQAAAAVAASSMTANTTTTTTRAAAAKSTTTGSEGKTTTAAAVVTAPSSSSSSSLAASLPRVLPPSPSSTLSSNNPPPPPQQQQLSSQLSSF